VLLKYSNLGGARYEAQGFCRISLPICRNRAPYLFYQFTTFVLVLTITRLFILKIITMEKQHYEISINAPREKVWKVLWGNDTYRAWTAAFSEGSHAETDWKKGSKVLFLDGKGQGMVSTIAENIPNEYMSFEHLGEVIGGVEDTESEKVKQWSGAHENYTLKSVNGKTQLSVDMDINDEFKDYFEKTFPIALNKVKELAEKN
jgi:hypothetical protein